jgi:hypothetical protein
MPSYKSLLGTHVGEVTVRTFVLDHYVISFIGLVLVQQNKNRKQRFQNYLYSICPHTGLSRAYFGHPPVDFVHHLLVITPDPFFDFVIPVCAKPHDRILARTHDKKRHHLACR